MAQLKVMRQALDAGIAVVPFTTGDAPFGEIGNDYLTRVTETQIGVGKMLAEWMVKTLDGKGNVIVHGGTPGNPMTASQAVGWQEVFAANPGITVLEGPVDTNWDPALAQKVTAAAIAKYRQIDGIMAETTGPIRAFLAAGRPIPGVGGSGPQRAELPLAGSSMRPTRPSSWRPRAHIPGLSASRSAKASPRSMAWTTRAQPDQPAVLRGQHVVRSGARGEVRQGPSADRDSLVDGLRRRR